MAPFRERPQGFESKSIELASSAEILATIEGAGVALVPVEPSEMACRAGAERGGVSLEAAREIYRAMLAAS